jgi:hypothetical protein
MNFDLNYGDPDDAMEPYNYSSSDGLSIPEAFNFVVNLLAEIDALEGRLERLDEVQGSPDGDVGDEDDDERLDTRCLIDMRYEDVDQLIEIYAQEMPATLDALVGLTAMTLALEHPKARQVATRDDALSTLPVSLVNHWLLETAERDLGSEFREFRAAIEYLINLPYTRLGAEAPCSAVAAQ